MNTNDILEDIISGLHPEDVPAAFIIMAKVTDHAGIERTIRGAELEAFLAVEPDRSVIAEARVILDVKKIRLAIIGETRSFFENLNSEIIDMLAAENAGDREDDAD